MQSTISHLRRLILDDRLLLLLAGGVFLSLFAFRIDAYGPLLSLLSLVVVARLAIARSLPAGLARPPVLAFLVLAAVVAAGYLVSDAGGTAKALSRLGYLAVLTISILMLCRPGLLVRIAPWLIGSGVVVHYLAWRLFQIPADMLDPLSHFLAAYAVLTIPALVYWVRFPRPAEPVARPEAKTQPALPRDRGRRLVFLLLLAMNLDLLLNTESTPAYLGILVALVAVLSLYSGWRGWAVAVTLASASGAVLWTTDYGGFATEIDTQIERFADDERVRIWSDTWSLAKESSATEWLFGNGVGRFRQEFERVSDPRYSELIFPHNHALEITYESGIAGLLAAAMLVGWPLWRLARCARHPASPSRRALGAVILFTYLAWLILVNLVFPFFSKSTLYPLGILLGVTLLYLRDAEPGHGSPSPSDKDPTRLASIRANPS